MVKWVKIHTERAEMREGKVRFAYTEATPAHLTENILRFFNIIVEWFLFIQIQQIQQIEIFLFTQKKRIYRITQRLVHFLSLPINLNPRRSCH